MRHLDHYLFAQGLHGRESRKSVRARSQADWSKRMCAHDSTVTCELTAVVAADVKPGQPTFWYEVGRGS